MRAHLFSFPGAAGEDMSNKPYPRTERIVAELRRLVGAGVHAVVRDHRLPSASVSDVEITRDLGIATIYITTATRTDGPGVVATLNSMASELRRDLAAAMRIRRVPTLRFRYDESVDTGERIDALLRGSPAAGGD